ncbi:hypothetical protein [Streptomyces wuyuanensis]|uniref:hypothetical protein n=1 Tax=Streptomyces wuyuanensis TaxID=1196353 RepID=UPI003D73DD4F
MAALGLVSSLVVTGCSSGEDAGEGKGPGAASSTRMHVLSRTPCALLEERPLAEGMVFRAGTDSVRMEPREDAHQDDGPVAYRRTSCYKTNGTPAQGGDLWLLNADAHLYEEVGPACHKKRIRENLASAQKLGPVAVDDATYWRNVEEEGRPGRELVMCDGNLLLQITALAPHGSERGSVDGTLGKVVEVAARLMEEGLRDPAAPSSSPTP